MKFTDLEEAVNSKVILNPMPFDVKVDYVKVTSDTVLVPIVDPDEESGHHLRQ